MELWILRGIFLLVAISLGASLSATLNFGHPIVTFLLVVLAAVGTVALDALVKRKRIDLISSVYFGLLIGLFLTFIVSVAMTPTLESCFLSSMDSKKTEVSASPLRRCAPSFLLFWVLRFATSVSVVFGRPRRFPLYHPLR